MPISASQLRATWRRSLFSFNLFIFNNLRIRSFARFSFAAAPGRSVGAGRRFLAGPLRGCGAPIFHACMVLFYRPAGLARGSWAIFSFTIARYPSASGLGSTAIERSSQIFASE